MDFENTEVGFRHLTHKELKRAYRTVQLLQVRSLALAGASAMKYGVRFKPFQGLVRNTLFRHFLAGESLSDALEVASKLKSQGVNAILDYAVESGSTPEECENATDQVLQCIQATSRLDSNRYVAVKLSAFGSIHDADPSVLRDIASRLDRVLKEAEQQDTAILIDAEQSWIQDPIDLLAESAMAQHNQDRCVAYTTVQLYRRDRLDYLRSLISRARGHYILGVKLVRGAYLEAENRAAARAGIESPIWSTKQKTDASYNEAVKLCLGAGNHVRLCIASHNEESCLIAAREISTLKSQVPRVIFAQLLGMADHLTYNLAHAGLTTAKYLPFGPVDQAVPYLIRRMQENSSVFGHAARQRQLMAIELKRRRAVTQSS